MFHTITMVTDLTGVEAEEEEEVTLTIMHQDDPKRDESQGKRDSHK